MLPGIGARASAIYGRRLYTNLPADFTGAKRAKRIMIIFLKI
jgi:hypothetical protein